MGGATRTAHDAAHTGDGRAAATTEMAPPRVARVMRNKSFGFDSSVYSLPDTPQQQPQRRSARGRASPSSADNNTASSASLSAAGNSTAAAAGEELDQAGDGSPAPRKSKRQKTEKQHQQQQQQQQQPSPPPTSSSSPRQKQFTNVVDESSYSVAQAETPTFMRTVAMRTSLAPPPTRMSLAGLGVPQADSSRRKSVEMRGRRPSSIGGGFDSASSASSLWMSVHMLTMSVRPQPHLTPASMPRSCIVISTQTGLLPSVSGSSSRGPRD